MEKAELLQAIREAKKKTGTVILAHTYQDPDIIDVADVTGDSFFLSKKAAEMKAKRVILCGVRFMAESVKILSPETEVLLPEPLATCPMAEQIPPEKVKEYKKQNPDTAVVAYINTTAALKAECDVCVTSSSALKIVKKLPNKDILFIPDKNLGSYVSGNIPEKNIILWNGYCPVHNKLTVSDILPLKEKFPDAVFAVHPEAPAEVVKLADMAGATSEIIKYALAQKGNVLIGTEKGVVDYLSTHEKDGNRFIQVAPEKLCCDDMKMTTPEKLLACLKGECGEKIELSEELRQKALVSINKMLELG